MASDDIYLRKDVYEADQRALRMEISLGNERILKALEEFRAEVNDKFSKVDIRLNSLETKFNALEAKVDDMGVYFNSRISDTHTYMGWGFATIGIIVAIAVVVIPLTKLFKEFFKPSVTVEQVKEISRSIAEEVVNAKLQTM